MKNMLCRISVEVNPQTESTKDEEILMLIALAKKLAEKYPHGIDRHTEDGSLALRFAVINFEPKPPKEESK